MVYIRHFFKKSFFLYKKIKIYQSASIEYIDKLPPTSSPHKSTNIPKIKKAGNLAIIVLKYLRPITLRPTLSDSLPFSTFYDIYFTCI